jgi:hypothetical protein
MFVGHEAVLQVGFDVAQARLKNLIHGNALVVASRDSYGDGFTRLLRVGPLGSAPAVSRLVEVRFRDLVQRQDSAVLTLRWDALGPGGGLVPALDADLTLTPVSGQTRLRLDGSYRPPLGALGEHLDRAILHRVADATIQSFVARVASAIVDHVADTAPDSISTEPSRESLA